MSAAFRAQLTAQMRANTTCEACHGKFDDTEYEERVYATEPKTGVFHKACSKSSSLVTAGGPIDSTTSRTRNVFLIFAAYVAAELCGVGLTKKSADKIYEVYQLSTTIHDPLSGKIFSDWAIPEILTWTAAFLIGAAAMTLAARQAWLTMRPGIARP